MAKSPDVRNDLTPILTQWIPFSGPSRLTPKVQVLLDARADVRTLRVAGHA